MNQGRGSDIPGLKDLRDTNVGVVQVAPEDERKDVLSAIFTQEKLGRDQIAVVLPERSKAFQRGVDFEDMKALKRRLRARIVFIAPNKSAVAEMAYHRRFPVYSTLENYARALQEDERAHTNASEGKFGWLFGSAKQKQRAQTTPPVTKVTEQERSRPPMQQKPPTTQPDYHDVQEKETNVSPALAAGAGFLAGEALAHEQHQPTTTPHTAAASNAGDDVNWDLASTDKKHSSPPPTPQKTGVRADDVPIGGAVIEPNIIELPARGRNTAHLPSKAPETPAAQSVDASSDALPANNKSRESGKLAAAAGVGALGAGAALAANSTAQRSAVAQGSPPAPRSTAKPAPSGPIARAGGGGVVPPNRGYPGGGGGGGGGPRRGRSRSAVIALIAALLLLVLLFALAFAFPSALGPLKALVPGAGSAATVTITPDSKVVSNRYEVTAVPDGTTDAQTHQVKARTLKAQQSQTKTVAATGHAQTPGKRATGTLTFFNGSVQTFTVAAGTVLQSANGVSVITDAPAVIPGANLPTVGSASVTAHAAVGGEQGNIGAATINGTCCTGGGFIKVRNDDGFTGGQDPKDYNFVKQSDVDAFASAAATQLTKQANDALSHQLQPGEQLAGASQASCQNDTNADQPVGDQGKNVTSTTVTETVTCNAVAYDQGGLHSVIMNLLQQRATKVAGTGYAPQGNIVIHPMIINSNPDKSFTLDVDSAGLWVYQFTNDQKQALARLVAGKSAAAAKALLKGQKGVHDASVSLQGDALPSDPGQISISIQDLPALKDNGNPIPVPTTGPDNPAGAQTPSSGKGVVLGEALA